jgi:hypothetical protein
MNFLNDAENTSEVGGLMYACMQPHLKYIFAIKLGGVKVLGSGMC